MSEAPPLGRTIPETPFDADIAAGQAKRAKLKAQLRKVETDLRALHRKRIDHQQETLFDADGKVVAS